MSQPLLSVALARLNLKPPVLPEHELREHPGEIATAWEAAGILRPALAATSVPCAECGRFCCVQMEFDVCKNRRGFISCPECGLAEIELASLRRWSIAAEKLIASIFQPSGATVAVSELAPELLWRIGKATWGGRTRELLFTLARRCDQGDAAIQIVRQRPKSVLFVPSEANVVEWSNDVPNTVVAVDSVASMHGATFAFDLESVAALLPEPGLAAPTVKKPTPKRRSPRIPKIELLENELIRHLKSARDHAHWTKEETGTPELLPRPTQKELGDLTGIAEWDVSRCLNDDKAPALRLYWESAADLERILRWRGRVKRSRKRAATRRKRSE
jgi:hypothetical protein